MSTLEGGAYGDVIMMMTTCSSPSRGWSSSTTPSLKCSLCEFEVRKKVSIKDMRGGERKEERRE